jgi:hypothetical protein
MHFVLLANNRLGIYHAYKSCQMNAVKRNIGERKGLVLSPLGHSFGKHSMNKSVEIKKMKAVLQGSLP